MYLIWFGFAVFFTPSTTANINSSSYTFPPGFLIGCASSAYQIEGAWNADGKGESVWDHLAHNKPDLFYNKDNGDIACDSYYKYKEDVQNVRYLGVTHYRLSLSWPRILPTGYDNNVSQAGVEYYHNLIDELIKNGIIPVVTLFHWDLPQNFQELGGWTNSLIVDYFIRYANFAFTEFGHKVKWWITLNEPYMVAMGYGEGILAPALHQHGTADYLAAHSFMRAHGKVYQLYHNKFRHRQKGRIGISLNAQFAFPLNNVPEDKLAATRYMEFMLGIFANPIFTKEGNYPKIVRASVDCNSKIEGRSTSRLPKFTKDEICTLKGSADFFGLNHYYSIFVTTGVNGSNPSWSRDSRTAIFVNETVKSKTPGYYNLPWGFRGLLNFIRTNYGNPPVLVTENGFKSDEEFFDLDRIQFYHDYMGEMLNAIHEDGCNVIGYTAWSCMDSLEWFYGYSQKFGFYHVDFNSTNRLRKKKLSADYFKKLIETNRIPDVQDFGNGYL